LNLLTISFQQAGPGGCLSISTKTVYLGVGDERECNIQEGEYVVLCVADKGEGITDEDALRIFEPFYIRKVMKRKATGLELTIAREVIKEHNGFIDLRSKVGVGSIFTVYLPVLCMQNPQTRIQANRLDVLETISGVH
jgi:signal transduction histidine kinase